MENSNQTKDIIVIDCESDGLYGEVFVIAAVRYSSEGAVLSRFYGAAEVESVTDNWVRENVLPVLEGDQEVEIYHTRRDLRDAFVGWWQLFKKDAIVVADFGTPVEAGLFRKIIEENPPLYWEGPYPLHELGTMLLAAGVDPDVCRIEYSGLTGCQKHNALDDVKLIFHCWKRAVIEIPVFMQAANTGKTLHNSDISGAHKNVPDIKVFGDGDAFKLICKASSKNEGWMKSTKAMEIPGVGCVVQVTTQQTNPDGSSSVAEAVTFVQGVAIEDMISEGTGDVYGRRLVARTGSYPILQAIAQKIVDNVPEYSKIDLVDAVDAILKERIKWKKALEDEGIL